MSSIPQDYRDKLQRLYQRLVSLNAVVQMDTDGVIEENIHRVLKIPSLSELGVKNVAGEEEREARLSITIVVQTQNYVKYDWVYAVDWIKLPPEPYLTDLNHYLLTVQNNLSEHWRYSIKPQTHYYRVIANREVGEKDGQDLDSFLWTRLQLVRKLQDLRKEVGDIISSTNKKGESQSSGKKNSYSRPGVKDK